MDSQLCAYSLFRSGEWSLTSFVGSPKLRQSRQGFSSVGGISATYPSIRPPSSFSTSNNTLSKPGACVDHATTVSPLFPPDFKSRILTIRLAQIDYRGITRHGIIGRTLKQQHRPTRQSNGRGFTELLRESIPLRSTSSARIVALHPRAQLIGLRRSLPRPLYRSRHRRRRRHHRNAIRIPRRDSLDAQFECGSRRRTG